jgi:phosphoribosylaminoimidazole carboxylase PurE protein
MSGTNQARILIIIGSESDRERIAGLPKLLDWFDVDYQIKVCSAHRSPEQVAKIARTAESSGFQVIIAAAGMSAHLPGVISARTNLPIIGVPLDASPLRGVDALYSIVQMPSGVPVAAVGIDGAVNAGVLAVRILALVHPQLKEKLQAFVSAGCKI